MSRAAESSYQYNNYNDYYGYDDEDEDDVSQSFYTSRGHKLNVLLSLDQSNRSNEYIAIYFHTEEVNFDDVVKWPMRASLKYCVLINGAEEFKATLDTTISGNVSSFKKPSIDSTYDDASSSYYGACGNDNYIFSRDVDRLLYKRSLSLKIEVQYY